MLAAKKEFEEIDTAVNTQNWVCTSQKNRKMAVTQTFEAILLLHIQTGVRTSRRNRKMENT
jgi:hypothetical protein